MSQVNPFCAFRYNKLDEIRIANPAGFQAFFDDQVYIFTPVFDPVTPDPQGTVLAVSRDAAQHCISVIQLSKIDLEVQDLIF